MLRPEYSTRFQCIGADCEDTCCAGWNVVFDEAACQRYQAIPPGELRDLLDTRLDVLPPGTPGMPVGGHARVRLNPDHTCPFLTQNKLCRIQVEHGPDFLSTTCKTYPRMRHRIDGLEETALTLSCPEAARLVLGSTSLLASRGDLEYRMTWDDSPQALSSDPRASFWPVREFVLRLLTNRDYALWQRLFLVGVFLRQLEALWRGELEGGITALIDAYAAAVVEGSFTASMETIYPDWRLQLDLASRLAAMPLPRTRIGARFQLTARQFTEGIGKAPGSELDDLIRGYRRAHRKFYEPFFDNHPHILENLLVNQVFKTLFPFGLTIGSAAYKPDLSREFALLAAQFCLYKGLLIGVAGFHRRAFSEQHVVATVQTAAKHFEHHPDFFEGAYKLLQTSGMLTPRGLTMLIRN